MRWTSTPISSGGVDGGCEVGGGDGGGGGGDGDGGGEGGGDGGKVIMEAARAVAVRVVALAAWHQRQQQPLQRSSTLAQ